MCTGYRMFMWLGRSVSNEFIQQLFGANSVQELDRVRSHASISSLATALTNIAQFSFRSAEESPLSARIRGLIKSMQADTPIFQQLHVVKQVRTLLVTVHAMMMTMMMMMVVMMMMWWSGILAWVWDSP